MSMRRYLLVIALAALSLNCMQPITAQRREFSLDGQWEFVRVKSLDEPPPARGWNSIQVPGTIYGYNYERAWFRRKFFVAEEWRRSRLFLHFGGVKYNSRIFVNGQQVGSYFNGYDAFEVDITKAVRFGAENELLVGVHDWTGVFVGPPVDFEKERRPDLRETPQDRVIAPIGGRFADYGLWDSVTLRVVPPVYFKDLRIYPKVRQRRLEVRVTIVNTAETNFQGNLTARIFQWRVEGRDENGQWRVQSNPIATFPTVAVTVEPKGQQQVTLQLSEPPLQFWFPHQPQLYVLELRFNQPMTDVLRERFGWREFWCEKGDFYLNGKKVHLLATSWWPPTQGVTRQFVEAQLKGIKAMNTFAFRTHTQPWQRIWYEVADEVGLLMIPEAAIWNDDTVYRVNDPRFWDNYATHLRAMVRHLFNHPSIVMWSLTNEFYGARANDGTPEVEANLARMGLIVKAEDPTRPITYESDGDPGGIADVIGIHYPNEYPSRRLWPDDAYWMDQPRIITGGGGMFWDNQPFLWDRSKPVYIGEFLWAPSRDPSVHAIFFGDEAYRDHAAYRARAKAMAWRMQILAYRHYGVSGQSPWTVVEGGDLDASNPLWLVHRDMYRPLAAFIREHDSRFFGGEEIERLVELFNDTMHDLPKVLFRWELRDGSKVLVTGQQMLKMDSGTHLEQNISLPLPEVSSKRRLTLRLTMEAPEVAASQEETTIEVFPRVPLVLPKVPVAVYDPQNTLSLLLQQGKARFVRLNRLRDWDGKGILIIAPKALAATKPAEPFVIGAVNEEKQWLAQKVRAGGRLLVLEQTAAASDWLPIPLTDQMSTMAFPHSSHPVVRGLTAEDLRWWRGDHLVSHNEPTRPIWAGMMPLVVTGSEGGVSHAPLVEVRQGNGVWLICQLMVVSKWGREPMAHLLLQRMLDYLANYRSTTTEVLYWGNEKLHEHLDRLRVDWRPLKNWQDLRYPQARLLLVHLDDGGLAQNVERLRAFLTAGGTVLWHRPDLKEFTRLKEALKLPVTMQPYRGPALRAEGEGTLLGALFREDLYWLGPISGPEWEAAPLSTEIAEAVFLSEKTIADARRFEVEKGVRIEGGGNLTDEGELAFWSNGRARWQISFPTTGKYYFALMARGTPVEGIYPIAEVYLDRQRVGILYISSPTKRLFPITFFAQAGVRELTIAFVNDAWRPPEDRNLWLDYFLLAPVREGTEVEESLTTPPALVSIQVGRGRLVLSAIRWDEAGKNSRKAQRFITTVLTALGARFQGIETLSVVEAEQMTPQPNLPWFRREADHIYMGANGYVETQVRVVKAGRYRVGIWARGTPMKGVYPMVVLELDGKALGQVECRSDDWGVHFLTLDLPTGSHTLRLRFTNDAYDPVAGEDRNLWVDKLEFIPLP